MMKTSLLVAAVVASTTSALQPNLVGPFNDSIMDVLMPRSICKSDDSVEAKCYEKKHAKAYETSMAALRITNNGRAHCTGWLIGDQGHVLTNNHCIRRKSEASSLKFEAMAEGETCETSCKRALSCKGKLIHREPLEFIATGGSGQDDWTLLQLPEAFRKLAVDTYGFLRLRKSGPVLGERVYIPQHPRGRGKKIAMLDGEKPETVTDVNYTNGCGTGQVAYRADTQGGSSGSPVIGVKDNAVIAIHHCGGCTSSGTGANTAVHVDSIIKGLEGILPRTAFSR